MDGLLLAPSPLLPPLPPPLQGVRLRLGVPGMERDHQGSDGEGSDDGDGATVGLLRPPLPPPPNLLFPLFCDEGNNNSGVNRLLLLLLPKPSPVTAAIAD